MSTNSRTPPSPSNDDPDDGTPPTTRRLEAKIRRLKEEIRHAQNAVVDSQLRATNWSNPILTGEMEIAPAPLEVLVNCYPHVAISVPGQQVTGNSSSSSSFNAVDSEVSSQKELVTSFTRVSLHQELANWDRGTEVPLTLRHRLLMILVLHRDHINFGLNIQRLEQRILLSPTDAEALHPCLINAICLGAATVIGPDFDPYAKIFRERASEEIMNSLRIADRMEHLLWSCIILGWYWSRIGNDVQASALATTAARWAIAFGLHQMSDPDWNAREPNPILGPFKNVIHFAERINLWWAIWLLDRRVALTSGLPPSIQQDDDNFTITTVWPRSFEDVGSNPIPALWPRASVEDLFVHGSQTTNVANDCVLAIQAKCCALYNRANWVSHLSGARKPGDTYWTTFLSVENALREVQRTMPDVRDQREITPGEQDKRIHPSLLLGRACNQAATILLNLSNAHDGNGNEKNSYAKDQALETTRRMAEDVRQFSPLATFRSYHLCLGPTWFAGAELCIREIHRLAEPHTPEEAHSLRNAQRDLDAFVGNLANLTAYFPSLIRYICRLATLFQPELDTSKIKMGPVLDLPLPLHSAERPI